MFSVGMVAWASGTTGLSGVISDANALLGSKADDRIGSDGITLLANGNYVVRSSQWDNGSFNGAGAATWGNGNSGVSGRISASNSLVGTSSGAQIGSEVTALSNGNYVVNAFGWRNALGDMVGATTWANGATGITGTISEANSLVGTQGLDGAVSDVVALSNGNYVVAHPYWDNGALVNAGAVTWGNGTTGVVGVISPANSLVGTGAGNFVGFPRVVPLTNGNYVVSSSDWEGPSNINVGAVTWANGSTGLTGAVSPSNSLVGDFDFEFVGDDPQYIHEGVVALANGNYVVSTPRYGNGAKQNLGAVTWGNGATGTVGVVSATNSLTGSKSGDLIGISGSYKVTPLTNGNYVVISAKWQNEQGVAVGAATWVNGSGPHSGVVSSSNSVPGVSSVIALTGGDFVVSSREWVTRGNGATGATAELSLDTSLATDAYSVALPDGSYVVCSVFKDNAAITQAGAVTWSAANTAVVGEVSAGNSLVGTTATDNLCRGKYTPGITPLADSRYVVYSSLFDNGALIDAEAMTLGVGSLSGGINLQNSVIGTQAFGGNANNNVALDFDYDVTRSSLVVGHHFANRVTTLVLTNDVGPALTIGDVVIAEGNSGTKTATFTVQLSAASASPVNYDIATTNGRATAGSDYVARQLLAQVIPAGVTSKTFTVTINGDAVPETSESFTVNVSNVVGAKVADAQAIGRITNDDGAAISIGDVSIAEGDNGTLVATFTVSLFEAAASNVTYNIATSNGTAVAGSDYVASNLVGQSIVAGSTRQTFSVTINGDTAMEQDETFSVALSNVAGASVADGTAVGTINNDDFPILWVEDVAVAEGASGTTKTMTFTVRLSIPAITNVTYDVTTVSSMAEAGSDFVASQLTGQVIPAGSTSKTFNVTINGDDQVEPDEALNLYVNNIVGSPTTEASPIGWILNDEGVGVVPTLSISDVTVSEGDNGTKLANFTLSLSSATPATVGYDITTIDGTASSGSDYVASHLVAQRIAAGQTSKTVSVAINGDTDVELDETFQVIVSNIISATPGDTQGIGTIGDDDAPPGLSIADASVLEGNSGARKLNFTVSLTAPAGPGGVTFNIATATVRSTGNAATANSDFASVNLQAMTIAAGETSASFGVKILGDTRIEGNELFKVIVGKVMGANVARAEAIGTIINDDNASLQDLNRNVIAPSGITAIASIQGTEMLSPMMGEQVIVQGVVTAVRQDGFFLQTADAKRDANPATSDAIFVFTRVAPNKNASRGNLVEVSGQVREVAYHSRQKELSTTSIEAVQVTLIASGSKLPQPIILNASMLRSDRASTWLERFESMRVSVPKMQVVSPAGGRINDSTAASISDGRFYGVAHGTVRPFREPGIPVLEMATRGKIGRVANVAAFDGNPESLHVDSLGQAGSIAMSVDVGDVITGIVGILAQANDSYSLFTDKNAKFDVLSGATPRAASAPLASDFTIGNFNARRFFDDIDDPGVNEPVLTESAYALRLAKTANAICKYMHSPDILGVAEVEKQSTLSDLAEAVNSHAGNVLFPAACKKNPQYSAVMVKSKTANDRLGFLVSGVEVRPGVPRVQILSVTDIGKSARFQHADGGGEALFEQSPLLLQAKLNAVDGKNETLAVLVNQMQSTDAINGSDQASYGWPTRSDYVYAKRRAQMQFLVSLVDARQAGNSRERIVVLGGFESNEFSNGKDDLMKLIADPSFKPTGLPSAGAGPVRKSLVNMTLRMPQQQRYSVVRSGNAEALDHVLVSQTMFDGRYKLRTEFARINADFGEDNAGDFEVPVRVSDHDAVVLYLSRP